MSETLLELLNVKISVDAYENFIIYNDYVIYKNNIKYLTDYTKLTNLHNDLYKNFFIKYNKIIFKSYRYYFHLIYSEKNDILDDILYDMLILNYIYCYYSKNHEYINYIFDIINNINDKKKFLVVEKNRFDLQIRIFFIEFNKDILNDINIYIDLIKILLKKNNLDENNFDKNSYEILKKNHNGIMTLIKDALCLLYKKKLQKNNNYI